MNNDTKSTNAVSSLFQKIHLIIVSCFILFSTFVGGLFIYQVQQGLLIETDLQALTPHDSQNELIQLAGERLFNKFGNKIILLIGAGDKENALDAAQKAEGLLRESKGFQWLAADNTGSPHLQMLEVLKQHRHTLLSNEQRAQLVAGNFDEIKTKALRSLYSLNSWSNIITPAEDPLNLFNDYIMPLISGDDEQSVERGYPVLNSETKSYVLLTATISDGSFNLNAQKEVDGAISNMIAEISDMYPDIEILKSGVVFHAAEAAGKAQSEVSVIATVSILGIVVIFLLVFGSSLPLLISLGSVAFGCFSAFTICHFKFSGVHILTLVSGASLIGVAIDYSLHYLTRLQNIKKSTHRLQVLRSIFTSILMGLITSIIGYSFLAQADLPGLNQIAIFSISGLIASWLFVVSIYPYVLHFKKNAYPKLLIRFVKSPVRFWLRLGESKAITLILGVTLLSIIICVLFLKASEDVRSLHVPSQALLKQERDIRELLKRDTPNQFFLLSADSEQQLLQLEEQFDGQLEYLVSSGAIESYDLMSRYLPSQQTQQQNYALLRENVYGENNLLNRFMTDVGYDSDVIDMAQEEFAANQGSYLLPSSLVPASGEDLSALWLGKLGERHASLVALQGISDTLSLSNAADLVSGVIFVDKVERLSHLISEQRTAASRMLVVAYLIIILLLMVRYRQYSAALLAGIPLISTIVTLSILAITGTEITLFHVLALFLILGLGMDYSIFLYESYGENVSTLVAISLSAITSCLSFGLLSLSSSPMLSAFGITVLLASLINMVLVPVVKMIPVHRRS